MKEKWSKTAAGLMIPERIVNGKRIASSPAGMGVWAKVGYDILDKDGKILKSWEGPCHSFVRNFGLFVRGFLLNLDSALNVDEVLTDDAGASYNVKLKGGGGTSQIISTPAIMKFGLSSAAVDSTQFDLQGVQVNGDANVTTTLIVEDSTQTQFKCEGQVTNTSGGPLTVEEIGLYSQVTSDAPVLNNTTMMLRDLTGAVVVADTLTILGRYTFTIAV